MILEIIVAVKDFFCWWGSKWFVVEPLCITGRPGAPPRAGGGEKPLPAQILVPKHRQWASQSLRH